MVRFELAKNEFGHIIVSKMRARRAYAKQKHG